MAQLRFGVYIFIALIVVACSKSPTPIRSILEEQVTESQKITSSDAYSFGYSVATDRNWMVVGAPNDRSTTSTSYFGLVYLYQKDLTGNWQFIKRLAASDALGEGWFGHSVAISGNTIVVGTPYASHNTLTSVGAVYVFEKDQGGLNNWGEIKKVVARDRKTGGQFGFSVAISGNTLVVGSNTDDIGESHDQGSAYMFRRNAGGENNWGQTEKLLGSDLANIQGAYFGSSVVISGTTVIVGATGKGSAYIFERDQGGINNWGEVKKLVPSDLGYGFGILAISGNTLVVGAYSANGVRPGQGASYIFERNQGGLSNWGEVRKLLAFDGRSGDYFGQTVAINGKNVIVGAPRSNRGQGSVYSFRSDAGGINNWGAIRRPIVSDATAKGFGSAVAIHAHTVIVGAPFTKVGTRFSQGATYIFNY